MLPPLGATPRPYSKMADISHKKREPGRAKGKNRENV